MEDEIDIRDLLSALWRKKLIILAVTCIFFVIGMVLYGRKTDTETPILSNDNKTTENKYTETDFMLSRGVSKEYDGATSTYKLTIDGGVVTNLTRIATSKTFLTNVINELNLKDITVDELKKDIKIIREGSSDIFILVVTYEDTSKSIEISNMILEEITEKVNELYEIQNLIIVDEPRALVDSELDELKSRIQSPSTEEGTEVVTSTETNNSGSKKKVVLITLVGFVLASGSVIVVELLSNSVKNEEQLEKATNLRTLVRIPKTRLDLTDRFKILRVNLNESKSVLVTSAEKNDGKSFVAENLAKSYARFGKKTILINTDAVLDEKFDKEIKESKVKNLSVVLSENVNSELEDFAIENKIRKLEENYDIIIIDSKNSLESASSLTISKFVNSTVLVCSENKTKLENIVRAKNNIEDIGGNIIGNVLNNSARK